MDGVVILFILLAVLIFGVTIASTIYYTVDWEAIKKNKKHRERLFRINSKKK
jgi:hypothetical protein